MMNGYLNEKVLLTTSQWFYAPDGRQYRGVWGTLKAIHDVKSLYGFVPNRNHANWVIEIGDMAITGCQVLYCIKCPTKPPDVVSESGVREHEMNIESKDYDVKSRIYFTD